MKINITNREKIDAALKEVQDKCRTRCLDPDDLLSAIGKAEEVLESLCLRKAAWNDCTVEILPEKVANSYKSTAYGTAATITRGATGWFLTWTNRARCQSAPYGADKTECLNLTNEAKTQLPDSYKL